MHKDKLYMHKNRLHVSLRRILHPQQLEMTKKFRNAQRSELECAPKTEQNGTKSNMNSVHIAHEALHTSQSFIHVKSTASHRAFLTFFARNGESG